MIHRLITTWNKTNLYEKDRNRDCTWCHLALLLPKASGIGLLGQFFVGGLRAIAPFWSLRSSQTLSQHQKGQRPI